MVFAFWLSAGALVPFIVIVLLLFDFGFAAFWAGTNVAQIREMEAADLVNQLVLEMSQTQ